MRGTGSSDYRAKDLFVPERFRTDFRKPAYREGILWRRFTNFLPKVSGVPLGAARAAIDHVTEMMQHKIEMPGGRVYKNISRIQSVIADAEMILGAARSYVFSAMEREWACLEKNETPSVRERADAWLSRVNAAQAARDIIRMLYDAAGSAAIYSDRSPLDRALRDAETFCQHIVAQRKTLAMVGAMLLNADTPILPYI
jgi:alkylation response protein AidB-like acyl-CoA dehydrogenase